MIWSLNVFTWHDYRPVFTKKGCFNASAGVHLFSGFNVRQRSNRSINKASSLFSASVSPFETDMRRVLRSREGFANVKVLTISCNIWKLEVFLVPGHVVPKLVVCGLKTEMEVIARTFPVNLSCSTLLKFANSSKWMCANWARFSILTVNLPRQSIIERSIWLLVRPVNRILPVYISYKVQPTDQISIAKS